MKFVLFVNSECTLKFNNNTDNFLKVFFYILDPGEMKTHLMYLNRTQQRNVLQTVHLTENFILRV